MKKSKICPKCNSTEIYTNAHATKRGDRAGVVISGFTAFYVNVYACLACGYFEEYFDQEDLENSKKMLKIRSEWQKI